MVVVTAGLGLGWRVGWLAGEAPDGVVATNHVVNGGGILVALTFGATGGAGVACISGDTREKQQ